MALVKKSDDSPLIFVLKGLIPYSRPNLLLAFKPYAFFNELEKISNRSRRQLQSTLSQAVSRGYVERTDGVPRLTKKGYKKVRPFVAKRLGKSASLLVTFDIPEVNARKRRILRQFLKQREFKLVQRSVWSSKMDHREELTELIDELDITKHVDIYETVKLN